MKSEKYYKTIVIGAGAGGLFFGAACPVSGGTAGRTLILEKTNKIGTKLLMSGSGQCNLTHGGSIKEFLSCYGQSGKRIRTVLYRHNNIELQDFMQELGIPLTEREDGKIFPASMRAKDVRDALLRKCEKNGVEIKTASEATRIAPLENTGSMDCGAARFQVETADGEVYRCRNLIVAAGGSSYPTTGSDGSLLKVLRRDFPELTVCEPRPALVPVFVENYPFEALSGIGFHNVEIKIFEPKSKKASKLTHPCGDLLLTHKNFSGPVILNNSRDIFAGYGLEINFIFPYTINDMLSYLKEIFPGNRRMISGCIGENYLLPKKFISAVLDRINVSDKPAAKLSGSEISRIAEAFAKMRFTVSGTGGFSVAMATAGGVSLDEIVLSEMQSRKYPGLYFIGEVLDIDGDTGGYNLQFAYSSAQAAADSIYQEK
ncbi:MAG: aminoacetone oxidase family FAD-binding enzyme [Firmicutes bacterium]|nr:aminoacetone oxidase family FAD-binding enzyme [Bacillota bacterium]